ncbi:MAG: hypothetical protein IT559_06920 [Alphaproteobacteria bacterium]|nr:hypothetical protein [Alphaproteobacteria bacterium]
MQKSEKVSGPKILLSKGFQESQGTAVYNLDKFINSSLSETTQEKTATQPQHSSWQPIAFIS